ncbi:MAG TPA: nucleoside recognition domain-containing protein [Bacteroidales bacterium]|jgi:spore maturation protein SpmA|nr:MAG: Spore maturation protein B [Bacteroidetes bacterium ADurb.BinA012]HNV67378.1 nucleoside recognition domain-containing protein [Bacteroidales bacterium]HNY57195.1 nucleoside recognition domain-containing protein [Bacteroidales bacterium]HPV25773.1 nucleoside recognition domain-containing protein [Bacteroidales bacterium]HQL46656.1 nucleoside recognition domain-containing protein [Bacteroidales bacterium]
MALNYIWIAFFLIGFLFALGQLIFNGDTSVFNKIVESTFSSAKTGFEISLGLTGVLTLWMGLMKVGEKGGAVSLLSRAIGPLFRRLFPKLPANSPAHGSMMLNVAANMLGLDNAATPMGLKAMKEMQEHNPDKEVASDPMIMFLVLNASGLVIIPVTIMVYRAQMGAANPADIFIPILIATYIATLAGLISVAIAQKINLLNRVVLGYLGGLTALIGGIVWYFSTLPQDQINTISTFAANFILLSVIVSFIVMAMVKKVNVYEAFIEGAKDGFKTAVTIIPYLVAILVAIGVFRASGAMDLLVDGITAVVAWMGLDTSFTEALPTAFMKPLSGSGSRGMMIDAMTTHGADSFVGRLACCLQGSTDTVFYVLAVYFGSVGIKNTRYAVVCGLIADIVGSISAIFVAYLFFA